MFQLNISIDVFLSLGEEITAGNQTLHWMSLSHMQKLTQGFPLRGFCSAFHHNFINSAAFWNDQEALDCSL